MYACSTANVISTFVIEDHMLDWHMLSSWNKDIIIIIIIIFTDNFLRYEMVIKLLP